MLLLCNNYAFVFDDLFVRALVVCVVYTFNKITPPSPIKTGIERFLASMYWNCCGSYRRGCVAHWTKLLPMRLFIPNPSFRTSFRSLITCHAAQIHTFHSVAPMLVLTKLQIGIVRRSQGQEHHQKRSHKAYPDNDDLQHWLLQIASNYRNVMPQIKISNYLFFHLNKIIYLCGQ